MAEKIEKGQLQNGKLDLRLETLLSVVDGQGRGSL
jgi:hypothetical protein